MGAKAKTIKEQAKKIKEQASNKMFAFPFVFAQCEWVLDLDLTFFPFYIQGHGYKYVLSVKFNIFEKWNRLKFENTRVQSELSTLNVFFVRIVFWTLWLSGDAHVRQLTDRWFYLLHHVVQLVLSVCDSNWCITKLSWFYQLTDQRF